MYLEQFLGLDQYNDQYTFKQTPTDAIISFDAPDMSLVDVTIDHIEGTISAGLKGSSAAVCGVMYAKTFRDQAKIVNNRCVITLSKENHEIWPLFIIGPSTRGIDPKSLFVLGFYKISTFSEESAFSSFEKSADMGYIPAKLCVADILLSDTNPYDVPKDINRAIEILKTIPVARRDPVVSICLSNALLSVKDTLGARRVLEESVETSSSVKLALVKMISPIYNKNNKSEDDAVTAVKYLESLASRRNPQALKMLSLHLAKGKGIQKDYKKAIELEKLAHSLDSNIPIELKESTVLQNLLVVGLASGFVLSSFIFLYKKFQKSF